MDDTPYDFSQPKKTFSRIGLAFSVLVVIATLLQLAWVLIPSRIWGDDHWMVSSSWGQLIGSFAPLYLIAIPVCLLIMKTLPAQKPSDNKLTVKNFLFYVPICFCLMYAGNIIGTILSFILSFGKAQNPVADFTADINPVKIIVLVILAPILEEYICRKQIIDRTRQFGEKTAVILSALVFGLLHQNLFQFFYAFALGIIFAYIYTRTGRLRYTILLHGIVNFMGGVVAPWIVSLVDYEALTDALPAATPEELMMLYAKILPALLVLMLYSTFLIGMAVTGLVFIILKRNKLIWKESETQLPKGSATKTVYMNVGMILYILLCIVFIIWALF